jgi:hypothetical protein
MLMLICVEVVQTNNNESIWRGKKKKKKIKKKKSVDKQKICEHIKKVK